jgi:hypothetical protein
VLILAFGLIKMPIALLMIWVPMHNDRAVSEGVLEDGEGSSGEDEGGSKTRPGDPRRPHPCRPLRGPQRPRRGGPHGAPAPSPPARTRHALRPARRVRVGA